MNKKTVIIIIVILMLLGAGGLVAYHFLSGNLDLIGKDLISQDGKFSMSVPASWKESTPASATGQIAAENSDGSMYAMLSLNTETFENGSTVEDYVYSYINQIAANSDDPIVQVISVTPYEAQLGENKGYYFELDSVADGLSVHIWDFVFTGNGGYVHINVASSGEDYTEMASTAKGIISSVNMSQAS